jgi:hypothetical protein
MSLIDSVAIAQVRLGRIQSFRTLMVRRSHAVRAGPASAEVAALSQFSTSVELAALAPCSLVFSSLYVLNALSVAAIG